MSWTTVRQFGTYLYRLAPKVSCYRVIVKSYKKSPSTSQIMACKVHWMAMADSSSFQQWMNQTERRLPSCLALRKHQLQWHLNLLAWRMPCSCLLSRALCCSRLLPWRASSTRPHWSFLFVVVSSSHIVAKSSSSGILSYRHYHKRRPVWKYFTVC